MSVYISLWLFRLVVVISQVTGILRMRIDIEYYLLSSGGSFTLLSPSLNLIVIYL